MDELNFMQQKLKDFIDENPAIIKAMAQGYEFSMKFELPPKDEKHLKILGTVKIDGKGEMTLAELFNL